REVAGIAVADPIEVNGRGSIILPGTAAPLDVAIERIYQRSEAVINQSLIPPRLNPAVITGVNVCRVPLVGGSQTEIRKLGVRTDVTPKLVTSIHQGNGRRGRQRRGMGGQT